MAFDECTPYPCDYKYAKNSLYITHHWLQRCFERFSDYGPLYGYSQSLFPIVQGSVYDDLRIESCNEVIKYNADGYAIGGLSVGEPHEDMYRIIDICTGILPENKPRYLMGVGTPQNLLEGIERGIDMFDCVMPTRNGRNAMLFTWNGTLNMRNKKWADDFSPIDPDGKSIVDRLYTRAYLRHLFVSGELLAMQIASVHNLAFYLDLVTVARQHIIDGDYKQWKSAVIDKLSVRL